MSTTLDGLGCENTELEFALKFAVNTIERLDDLFGPGAADGGCALVLVHKSSPEWEECVARGEWDKPGDFCFLVRDEYYIYGLDAEHAKSAKKEYSADSETYVEIWFEDYCVSGFISLDAIEAASLVTCKGGDA